VPRFPLRGSLVALVTPLTPERAVDEGDVEALVRRAVDDGASGVLVAGSTGEGTLLEPEQRVQLTALARRTVDALDGARELGADAAPVVLAGASGPSVRALKGDVARLADAGADLALVLAPHTYPLSPDELGDLHLEFAETAPIPTFVYHIPQLTGSSLAPEVVAELAGHPRIAGMKDSSPDADRRAAFIEATSDVETFQVLTGHAPTLQAALAAGADGSITAIANVRQRQVVALHDAVARDDEPGAAEHQAAITRLSEAFGGLGTSTPATLKAALQLEGVIHERWCRPPLRSVEPARLDHVRSALLRAR
jgi:dihydrodipicolinate synthase/N-acetylneuraminate lyase